MNPVPTLYNPVYQPILQHGDSGVLLPWLRFEMFHHPIWAVGSYSSGQPAIETPKFQSTQSW